MLHFHSNLKWICSNYLISIYIDLLFFNNIDKKTNIKKNKKINDAAMEESNRFRSNNSRKRRLNKRSSRYKLNSNSWMKVDLPKSYKKYYVNNEEAIS